METQVARQYDVWYKMGKDILHDEVDDVTGWK
jgi:hypothetical protein